MITNAQIINWLDRQIRKPQDIEDGDMLEAIRNLVLNANQEQAEIKRYEARRGSLKLIHDTFIGGAKDGVI